MINCKDYTKIEVTICLYRSSRNFLIKQEEKETEKNQRFVRNLIKYIQAKKKMQRRDRMQLVAKRDNFVSGRR